MKKNSMIMVLKKDPRINWKKKERERSNACTITIKKKKPQKNKKKIQHR
jgi:hypothetical protein